MICSRCKQECVWVKNLNQCRPCRNEKQNEWKRRQKDHKCAYCKNSFIPNSVVKECSLKCRILNRIKVVNGCWEWQGKITKVGYGEITFERKYRLTHRASYEIHKGEIPKGKSVCHTCDNRKCCNPDHLWIGTQKQNIEDALKKNRMKGPKKEF